MNTISQPFMQNPNRTTLKKINKIKVTIHILHPFMHLFSKDAGRLENQKDN